MTGSTSDASPQTYGRIAGVLYLLEAMAAVFGQIFVLGRVLVRGDAAATAANILEQETMFRLGYASSLLAVVFHVAWALLLYELLKPVSRRVSLLSAFFILVACPIQALAGLAYAAPLIVLKGGSALGAFTVEQLQTLALVFLRLNAMCFNAYLVFFGVWCGLVGYLIVRSSFLPRIIGVLMVVAGLAYLILLWPPLAAYLYPYNLALAAPGEISLLLWLLVKGVNAPAWLEATNRRPAGGRV